MRSQGRSKNKEDGVRAYRLSGFPKNATLTQIREFLPEWLFRNDITLNNLYRSKKTSSCTLACPGALLSKNDYKRLCKFLVEARFNGGYIIGIGPMNTPATNGKKKSNKKKKAAKGDMDPLERSFWEFITLEKDVSICERDEVSTLFAEFCSMDRNMSGLTNRQLKQKEYAMVTGMRRFQCMKSKRANNYSVLAYFKNPDNLEFPPPALLSLAETRMQENLQLAKANKGGVTITELGDRITGSIGEDEFIPFDIQVTEPVILNSVEMKGPHRSLFKLSPGTNPLSQEIIDSLQIEVVVKPQMISVLRAKVYFNFDGFFIVRAITMSCGHAEMNQVLQPTSPYKRQKYRNIFREASETCGPPKQMQRSRNEENPFQNLSQYTVPEHIQQKLVQNAFDTEMEANEWERSTAHNSSTGYGDYWENLLWASEHQTQKDIQMYDMENVQLTREGRYFLFTVPGLAEGRPSVLRGDLVNISFGSCLYKGRVVTVRLLEVVLDMHTKFANNYNPSMDRVSVRFTFSRMTYRTSHNACGQLAEKEMGALMLVPAREHIVEVKGRNDKVVCPICFEELGGAVAFTTAYCRGQCRQHFHEQCIQRWLAQEQQRHNPTCPMCRERWVGGSAPNNRQRSANTPVQLAPWANRSLNPEQQAAIQRIANASLKPLPYIIFGPPGTGKTTTVVETIYQLGKKGKKILLVAPSNDAADILVERLSSYFPPSELRRILAYSRSIESVPQVIRQYARDLLDFKEQASEIMSSQIVVSTVNLAARFSFWGIPRGHFEVLCVDEAGHATEPEVVAVAASLMSFQNSSNENIGQLILAGDPKQLGPITSSDICLKYGLSVSYMERLTERSIYQPQENGKYPEELLTKLVRNYRSHPAILKLPNEMFYKDLQCCGDTFVTSNMARWEYLKRPGFPIIFHAMDGENLREGNSPSWFNPEEVQQVYEYVHLLTKETRPPVSSDEIGIITPYARQAQKIRQALRMQDIDDIKVGSVECFQGQERRVIIMSTVRAQREQVQSDIRFNLGFVASPKRFNVAITRAKALLIVIGCPSVLAMDKDNWLPFMNYCHENQSWAGEEWDPASADEEESEESGAEDGSDLSSDDFETINAPSQAAQQEGFVFVNREE